MSILDTLVSDNLEFVATTKDLLDSGASYAQFVSSINSKNPKDYGLFLIEANASTVGFSIGNTKLWSAHEQFLGKNDEATPGFISRNPRMLIIAKSKLGKFRRETNEFLGYKTNFYEPYDPTVYLKTKYVAILLNEKNEALHKGAITFSAKGVLGAQLNDAYTKFKTQFQACFDTSWKDPFWTQIVFQPTISWTKTKGGYIVAGVPSYVEPSNGSAKDRETLEAMILPKDSPVRQQIKDALLAYKDGVQLVYIPPAESEELPDLSDEFLHQDYPKLSAPENKQATKDFMSKLKGNLDLSGDTEDTEDTADISEPSIPF